MVKYIEIAMMQCWSSRNNSYVFKAIRVTFLRIPPTAFYVQSSWSNLAIGRGIGFLKLIMEMRNGHNYHHSSGSAQFMFKSAILWSFQMYFCIWLQLMERLSLQFRKGFWRVWFVILRWSSQFVSSYLSEIRFRHFNINV